MAAIIHRRPVRPRGLEPARGPGGSFDSLTWVGYASLVVAFGFLVFGLRPLAAMGDSRLWDWTQVFELVLDVLRDVAVAALPAALELGVPGARRAVPWLMRGAVLLALELLLRALIQAGQSALSDSQLFDWGTEASYATPGWIALILASLAVSIVGIAGVWSLSDGLSDAGGRLARRLLVVLVAIGSALVILAYVPALAIDSSQAIGASEIVLIASNLAGFALSVVDNALWLVIGARLVAGLVAGRRPRAAWAIGAVAGIGLVLVRLATPVLFGWLQLGPWVGWAFLFASSASWVLLVVAFAAGLGRGRVRRRPRPRRVRLFVLDPTS